MRRHDVWQEEIIIKRQLEKENKKETIKHIICLGELARVGHTIWWRGDKWGLQQPCDRKLR
jgi:hypothetical protein